MKRIIQSILLILFIQFSVSEMVWSQGCPDNMQNWILTYNDVYNDRSSDHFKIQSYQPGLKDPIAGFDVFPSNTQEVLRVGSTSESYDDLIIESNLQYTGQITPENNKVMVRFAFVVKKIPEGTTLHSDAQLNIIYGLDNQSPYGSCSVSHFVLKEQSPFKRTADGQYIYFGWSTFLIDLTTLTGSISFPELEFQLRPPKYIDASGNIKSTFAYLYIDTKCYFPDILPTTQLCVGETLTLKYPFESQYDDALAWNYGRGNDFTLNPTVTYDQPGTYSITLEYWPSVNGSGVCGGKSFTQEIKVIDCKAPPFVCETCIPDFSPLRGERYIINAWVRQGNGIGYSSYNSPGVSVNFLQGTMTEKFRPKGPMVDGWQQIIGEFIIPEDANKISIQLSNDNDSEEIFFDDIRVQPFNSSLKSFVYDPVSLRLVAELDERNFASFYEYDEEGSLVRVKKETERGIKTISESRTALRKRK